MIWGLHKVSNASPAPPPQTRPPTTQSANPAATRPPQMTPPATRPPPMQPVQQTQENPQGPPPQQTRPANPALDPRFQNQLDKAVEELRKNNPGIRTMEYFYRQATGLNTTRIDELRQFKAQGGKVVGVLCNFVPEELVLASGAVPISLNAGFGDSILPAEEVIPRNFCPLLKSSYGFMLMNSPYLELVDAVIIPTSCDGKKKIGEMIAEKAQVWIMEVPSTTGTPLSRKLWLDQMRFLKERLEGLTGTRITSRRLKKSIDISNRRRGAVHRLYELRKRPDPPIHGRDALLVTTLAFIDEPTRWLRMTEQLLGELEQRPGVSGSLPLRILVTGSPVVFPTWKIPMLIEDSGGIIVMDDICTGTKGLWDNAEPMGRATDDLLLSLADRTLMNTCACFTPNSARASRLMRWVDEWHIDGVIYHCVTACHTYGMERARIENALKERKMPVLFIETDFSQEDVEQIRTRLEAFLEMLQSKRRYRVDQDGQPYPIDKPHYIPSQVPQQSPEAPMAQGAVASMATTTPIAGAPGAAGTVGAPGAAGTVGAPGAAGNVGAPGAAGVATTRPPGGVPAAAPGQPVQPGKLFVGLDVGSLNTKVVLMDGSGIVSSGVSETGMNPRAAIENSISLSLEKVNKTRNDLAKVVATGSGKKRADFAHESKSEIVAFSRGARFLSPESRILVDLGGQSMKVVLLDEHGGIDHFVTNDKCSSGTGCFLDTIALAMDMDIEDIGSLSEVSNCPTSITTRCTIFAESEVISLIARGTKKEDIMAGLTDSVAKKVSSAVKGLKTRGTVFFAGGVALNQGVVKALRNELEMPVVIPEDPITVTALGAAIMARDGGGI